MVKNLFQKYWFNILGTLILCGISFGAGWWVNERLGNPDERLLKAVYRITSRQSIFNQKSATELSYAAVRGMISAIDDPYVELIEPEAAANFLNTYYGKMGVVGIYVDNHGKQAVISIVFPNGSAEQAGLRAGDILLSIDGHPLDQDTDSSEAGLLIRGEPGTTVHLQVQRAGQVLEYNLVRKEQQFVSSQMLPGGIGYISLTAYNQVASKQMKQVLESILQHNPTGLIWDLRNNEGGDMQAAQEILSYFIDDGLLFTAELTYGRTVPFMAQKGKALAGSIPLVVLIDHTTYSAAETSAAAIAEIGRGMTIGSQSYGKGVIQATTPLPDGSMLQMTVAKWLSPNGEWYHKRGVPPKIEISDDPATDTDEILQKAIEVLQNR